MGNNDKIIIVLAIAVCLGIGFVFFRGNKIANGRPEETTRLEMKLGKPYKIPGHITSKTHYYSGVGYSGGKNFVIITRDIGAGYAGAAIEIRVRMGATVYLQGDPYKLIEIHPNYIVLEAQ